MPGRGLATTAAPARCTPAPGPSSSAMAASCQATKRRCAPCRASGPTPRARCGRSSTARRAFRSTATRCVSWRACIGSRPLCPMPPTNCAIWPDVSPAPIGRENWPRRSWTSARWCAGHDVLPVWSVHGGRACQAHLAGLAEELPRRAPKRARPVRRGLAFLLARPDGAILFRRRPAGGLLGGLHELPSSPWQEGPLEIERALAHAPSAAAWRVHPTADPSRLHPFRARAHPRRSAHRPRQAGRGCLGRDLVPARGTRPVGAADRDEEALAPSAHPRARSRSGSQRRGGSRGRRKVQRIASSPSAAVLRKRRLLHVTVAFSHADAKPGGELQVFEFARGVRVGRCHDRRVLENEHDASDGPVVARLPARRER